jgi:hypothetical protein
LGKEWEGDAGVKGKKEVRVVPSATDSNRLSAILLSGATSLTNQLNNESIK